MGKLWGLIEAYRDGQPWPPSYRAMALKVGIAPTGFMNWREPKALPGVENLHRLAELIGVPYSRVLDAALVDAGYYERTHDGNRPPTTPAGDSPAQDVIKSSHPAVLDEESEPGPAGSGPLPGRGRRSTRRS